MSLKDNSVILYFDSHPDGGEFIKKPILDLYCKEIKSLLVEDARWLPHEEFENTRLGQLISERWLSSFYQSELDLYISLLERKWQILSAEFSHEPKSEDEIKFHDRNSLEIQKLMISWNNLCLVEKLSSLKEYFNTYTQYIFWTENREWLQILMKQLNHVFCVYDVHIA